MRYELVFHFERDAFRDNSDAVFKLEETLRSILADSVDLELEDLGVRGVNFLIQTRDPAGTFARCKYVLQTTGYLDSLNAAFRKPTTETFTVVWPEKSKKPFVLD